MSSEKTKWHSLPWLLVIGGAILSPAITDIYNKVPIYTSFVGVWDKLVAGFLKLMNWEIKFWWLLIIWGAFGMCKSIYEKLRIPSKAQNYNEHNLPFSILEEMETSIEREQNAGENYEMKLLNYKADKVNGIIWKWDWIYNDLINQYEAKRITPVCPNPNCENTPMIFRTTDYKNIDYYVCPKCEGTIGIEPKNKLKETIILEKLLEF